MPVTSTMARLGNLNAAKDVAKAFWRRRALRRQDRWVLRVMEDYTVGIVQDLGGPETISRMQKGVIELAALAHGCQYLILDALRERGGIDPVLTERRIEAPAGETKGSVTLKRKADLLASLAKFMAIEEKALSRIGLARQARPVDSLAAVTARILAAREAKIEAQAVSTAATSTPPSEPEGVTSSPEARPAGASQVLDVEAQPPDQGQDQDAPEGDPEG